MHKKAFTMAEVLITLGIIGIVAAMTMPGVIKGYQKEQMANQLKKVYSVMQQALQRAEVDYEGVEFWNFSLRANEFTDMYIKPYYQILTDYDNTDFPSDYHTYCLDGRECDSYGAFQSSSRIILNDGTLLAFHPARNTTPDGPINVITIIADINGFKKPNQYGRDIFMFSAEASKGIRPYGMGTINGLADLPRYHTRDYLLNGEYRSCQYDGVFCAAIIMIDNWEIKDDYPW